MNETKQHIPTPSKIERIGVCESKGTGIRTIYHRIKVRLSRQYRVWMCPGDSRYQDLDPSAYMEKYTTVSEVKPK